MSPLSNVLAAVRCRARRVRFGRLLLAPTAVCTAILLASSPASAQSPAAPAAATGASGGENPAAAKAKAGAKAAPAPLPDAPVRLWLTAPSPLSPWTLRIDNEGDRPVRVPADVRLLRLEVTASEKRGKKTFRCAPPPGMRPEKLPEARGLILPPGHSYIESFDPRLLCFGKNAQALTGSAVVRARFGWDPPPKWSKKAPTHPYAADGTDEPPVYAPLRELRPPTMVLSFEPPPSAGATRAGDGAKPGAPASGAAKPAAPAPEAAKPAAGDTASGQAAAAPPASIVDERAPRLELSADAYVDASNPSHVAIGLRATNAGKRPLVVALRPRMASFRIDGAGKTAHCDAAPPTRAIPRDLYRTLEPGDAAGLSVVLGEICPDGVFPRQGLYSVTSELHANERGTEVGLEAYVADVPARAPTLVRIAVSGEPYYAEPPKAVPTPRPPTDSE